MGAQGLLQCFQICSLILRASDESADSLSYLRYQAGLRDRACLKLAKLARQLKRLQFDEGVLLGICPFP